MDLRSIPAKPGSWHIGARAILACALLAGGLLTGCGGTLDDGENVNLGIPYRAQAQYNYCVPASILMWRLHDGLSEISQITIWDWLGGPPCTADEVPAGVNHFTNTHDTYADIVWYPTMTRRDEIIARQITSSDNATPAITVVYPSRNHVGVINKGKYDTEAEGYWTWEWLKFHNPDPSYGANYYYTGGDWLLDFCRVPFSHCAQIVSSSAIAGWGSNYNTYGDSVAVYGGGGGCRPGECGPPDL